MNLQEADMVEEGILRGDRKYRKRKQFQISINEMIVNKTLKYDQELYIALKYIQVSSFI